MIEHERHGDVAVLRLAHGKASAFDTELLRGLHAAVQAEQASSARAVVLTGSGRIFSAGVDLRRVLEGRSYLAEFLPALDELFLGLAELEKPLVAAINGHAIAGGCVLACSADRRILSTGRVTIGAPELVVGVPFPPSAFEMVRASVPAHALREVTLEGRLYSPDEALDRGLVDELVEPDALLERALQVAQGLAAIPPASFALTKRQLWAPSRARAAQPAPEILEAWASDAVQSHVASYVEKTLGAR